MPQGCEIYDYTGTLVSGVGTTTLKSLTAVTVVDNAGSTSLSFPAGTTPIETTSGSSTSYVPQSSISGNTLTWSRPSGTSTMGGRIQVNLV